MADYTNTYPCDNLYFAKIWSQSPQKHSYHPFSFVLTSKFSVIPHLYSSLNIPDIRPKSPQNNHKGYRHPSEHGLQTKDLEIITEDHTILRGWLVHRSETDRIIVYFQGNAGSKKYIDTDLGWLTYFIKYLHILTNSDVVAVAYRGYSDSEGTPS